MKLLKQFFANIRRVFLPEPLFVIRVYECWVKPTATGHFVRNSLRGSIFIFLDRIECVGFEVRKPLFITDAIKIEVIQINDGHEELKGAMQVNVERGQ